MSFHHYFYFNFFFFFYLLFFKISVLKDPTKDYEQLLDNFILAASGRVQNHVLDVLKSAKAVIANPESYMSRQEVNRMCECLSKTLLNLVISMYLSKKSRKKTLPKDIVSLLTYAQQITEIAVELQTDTSETKEKTFNIAIENFIELSRSIMPHGEQDDLIQASNVLLLSNKKHNSTNEGKINRIASVTKFQKQAKGQLVDVIEELLVSTILYPFNSKLSPFIASGPHCGISKTTHQTFQYIQLLENEITADKIVKVISSQCPGFRSIWKSLGNQEEIIKNISTSIPTTDSLQYFNLTGNNSPALNPRSTFVNLDNQLKASEEEKSSESPNSQDANTTKEETSSSESSTTESDGPTRRPKQSNESTSKGRSRRREKRSSIVSTKKFRTFLRKKPSIMDEVIKTNMVSHLDNAKQLNQFSKWDENQITDINEMELETRSYQQPEKSSLKIIPTIEDLPALVQSFYSSVLLIAELCGK